jgi:hypothetical protein
VHASYQLHELPVFFLLSQLSLSHSIGFSYRPDMVKEGICDIKQLPEIEICSWQLVETLVGYVLAKQGTVVSVKALLK